jgi:dihydroorotase
MDEPFDLILRGGEVIDPVARRTFAADVGIRNGRVAAVQEALAGRATREIDARGLIAGPGWVDTHTHVFKLFKPSGLDADGVGVEQGVVAVIDAGSFGAENAPAFHEYVVKPAKTMVFGLLHISRHGNMHEPGESEIVSWLNIDDALKTIAANRDWIRGMKVRASASAVGTLGIMPVVLAKKAASEAAVPLMAHVGNAPPTLDEVCRLFEAGDVITHCFHGKAGGVFSGSTDRRKGALPAALDAAERGVVFDVGHGSGSFSHVVAREWLRCRLPVGHISTDLHGGNRNGPVFSLALTMSKLLGLAESVENEAMDLFGVVAAVSLNPAKTFGLDHLIGPVAPGARANLTVFRLVDREVRVQDSYRAEWSIKRLIVPRYAIVRGVVHEATHGAHGMHLAPEEIG